MGEVVTFMEIKFKKFLDHGQMSFDKGAKTIHWKEEFLQQTTLRQLAIHTQQDVLDFSFHHA